MVMKKRGLSDVVTVALVILLAIAAVVIVWTFVRATLENVGTQINDDCISTSVKVVSCPASGTPVVVENSAGSKNATKVKLIYSKADDSVSTPVDPTGCDNIAPLGRKSCATTPPAGSMDKVNVALIVGDKTCPVISRAVVCA